ncbi:MAG: AMP-binding protein [Synergistaceae bacterium]|jgi:acyl-[acyl-carrier-protein]-phospholipid O-acyltransferase/long-chain-fatty-acid--[acyl-carrier-protein] ligase|nr:AMP-binding protein [Synergistaceae bacterium]
MWRFLVKIVITLLYRPIISMKSLKDALASGDRVILAPHYSSYLDPVLFGILSPESPLVVVPRSLEHMWWFKFFKGCFKHVVMDMSDAASLKQIDNLWDSARFIVIFPEPEPTTNGLMMKISDVAIAAFSRGEAWVVPARACNAQFSPFSRMKGRFVRVLFPRITMLTGTAEKIRAGNGAKDSRNSVFLQVERMMNDIMMLGIWDKKPLFDTLLEQRRLWGGRRVMALEPNGDRINWNGFITRVLLLRRIVADLTKPGERIGIMMPNSSTTLAAIIGAQRAGVEPAMINYSMGARSLKAACSIAEVATVITSRRFVDEGKFQPLIDDLSKEGIKFVYLEDVFKDMPATRKILALLESRVARPASDPEREAERTAVVLFTSGSEGTPKPVALSHLNIQANTAQVRSTLDFYATDVLVDIMPMFHSFGLCTGTIMPLSAGMPIAFYPTPLHYKKIPQYSYEVRGTVLLGTNSFLAGYARNAGLFDFFEMRYVICGGDKLRDETLSLWLERFGIQVLEGYGVTECAPVVGVNRRGRNLFGSIGMSLPCVRPRVSPIEGVAEGGRLVINGPNVMRGYIRADGSILPPPEDGYDTGDIVTIDESGFITIRGRAKRFAKIGGEMISLAGVEEAVLEVWPDDVHAVVSIPSENRGEVIILLTERPSPDREELRSELLGRGLPEIALPKRIIQIGSMPRIGVGKIDYQGAAAIAAER